MADPRNDEPMRASILACLVGNDGLFPGELYIHLFGVHGPSSGELFRWRALRGGLKRVLEEGRIEPGKQGADYRLPPGPGTTRESRRTEAANPRANARVLSGQKGDLPQQSNLASASRAGGAGERVRAASRNGGGATGKVTSGTTGRTAGRPAAGSPKAASTAPLAGEPAWLPAVARVAKSYRPTTAGMGGGYTSCYCRAVRGRTPSASTSARQTSARPTGFRITSEGISRVSGCSVTGSAS